MLGTLFRIKQNSSYATNILESAVTKIENNRQKDSVCGKRN